MLNIYWKINESNNVPGDPYVVGSMIYDPYVKRAGFHWHDTGGGEQDIGNWRRAGVMSYGKRKMAYAEPMIDLWARIPEDYDSFNIYEARAKRRPLDNDVSPYAEIIVNDEEDYEEDYEGDYAEDYAEDWADDD